METKRITTWDVAKGFGIILVILGHLLPEESYLRSFIYSFHMPLFFILSGFILKCDEKRRTWLEIMKSEKKMAVTYVFWSVIYLGIDLIAKYAFLRQTTLLELAKQVLCVVTTYGINVLWFLGSLITGRIIAKKLLINTYEEKKWLITVFLIIVPAAISPVLNLINSWSVLILLIVFLRWSFVTGLLLFGYLIKDKVKNLIGGGYTACGSLLLLVNLVVAAYIGEVDIHHMELGIWPLFIISMITGTLGFICLCRLLEKVAIIRNGLVFLGINSLFIMLTHNYLYINDGAAFVAGLMTDNSNLQIAVSFLLLLAIEIILCYFVAPIYNNFIKRIVG